MVERARWGRIQQLGADAGAAGNHLLRSGGSVMRCRLLLPGLYFPLESSPKLCSSSHLMGGRENPWSSHNNPQCSQSLPAPCSKSSLSISWLLGQSLGRDSPRPPSPACPTGLSWPHRTPRVAGRQHGGERRVSSQPACIKILTPSLTSHVTGTAPCPISSAL